MKPVACRWRKCLRCYAFTFPSCWCCRLGLPLMDGLCVSESRSRLKDPLMCAERSLSLLCLRARMRACRLNKYDVSGLTHVPQPLPTRSNTVQTHVDTERRPTWLHPSHKRSHPSGAPCRPRPFLFPGFTVLHPTAAACSGITVEYYPAGIDLVGSSSLFLFQVRLAPWTHHSLVEQSFMLAAAGPQTSGHHRSHVPYLQKNTRRDQFGHKRPTEQTSVQTQKLKIMMIKKWRQNSNMLDQI